MKLKKIIISTLTVAIIASCLGACACSSQDELHKMIEKGEQIELEVATLDHEEKGTDTEIIWTELAKLTTYANFRTAFENAMGIQTNGGLKTGVVYVDLEGNQINNSTLYNAFMNSQFISKWSDETVQSQLNDGISTTYADLEDSDYTAAIINAYFNLLDDNQPNYFNGGASLSRAEAMTILMRAVTPVEELKVNDTFKSLVGESEYTAYASYMDSNAFISSSDKSISEKNFNGAMTRAEFVYMVMNQTFGKETVSNYDVSKVSLNDCKDAGDIATTEKFSGKDYCNSYVLTQMVKNPEAGATTSIYKALAMAKDLGIISAETRWDEAITKTEGIEIIANTFQAYVNLNCSKTENETGVLDENDINVIAFKAYEETADKLEINAEVYTAEFVRLVNEGRTVDETKDYMLKTYSKETAEPETEIEPQYRETVGNYTETFVEGAYVLRTWSNGAERYYYYDADITETYYELSKEEFDGRIRPSRVTNAIVEAIEKMEAEYSASGSTSSDNTTSNSNNTTEPSTTASETSSGITPEELAEQFGGEDPAAPINGDGVGAYDPDWVPDNGIAKP